MEPAGASAAAPPAATRMGRMRRGAGGRSSSGLPISPSSSPAPRLRRGASRPGPARCARALLGARAYGRDELSGGLQPLYLLHAHSLLPLPHGLLLSSSSGPADPHFGTPHPHPASGLLPCAASPSPFRPCTRAGRRGTACQGVIPRPQLAALLPWSSKATLWPARRRRSGGSHSSCIGARWTDSAALPRDSRLPSRAVGASRVARGERWREAAQL
jgi:hypothetical protein